MNFDNKEEIKDLCALADNKLNLLKLMLQDLNDLLEKLKQDDIDNILKILNNQQKMMLDIKEIDERYEQLLKSFTKEVRDALYQPWIKEIKLSNMQEWCQELCAVLMEQHETLLKIATINEKLIVESKNISLDLKHKIKNVNRKRNVNNSYNFFNMTILENAAQKSKKESS